MAAAAATMTGGDDGKEFCAWKNNEMSFKDDANVMKMFHDTQNELKAMEYSDFLGLDSMKLVRKILDDLVLTTESHEKLVKINYALEEEREKNLKQISNLQKENVRLVQENNELHFNIVQKEDATCRQQLELTLKSKSAEDNVLDPNLAASKWKYKIKQAENRILSEPDHLENISLLKGVDSDSGSDAIIVELGKDIVLLSEELNRVKMQLEAARVSTKLRENEIKRLGKLWGNSTAVESSPIDEESHQEYPDRMAQMQDRLNEQNSQMEDYRKQLQEAKSRNQFFLKTISDAKKCNADFKEVEDKLLQADATFASYEKRLQTDSSQEASSGIDAVGELPRGTLHSLNETEFPNAPNWSAAQSQSLIKQIDFLKSTIEKTEKDLRSSQISNEGLQLRCCALQEQVVALSEQLKSLSRQEFQGSVLDKSTTLKDFPDSVEGMKEQIVALRKLAAKHEFESKNASQELVTCKSMNRSLQNECMQLKQSIQELANVRDSTIEGLRAAERKVENANISLSAVIDDRHKLMNVNTDRQRNSDISSTSLNLHRSEIDTNENKEPNSSQKIQEDCTKNSVDASLSRIGNDSKLRDAASKSQCGIGNNGEATGHLETMIKSLKSENERLCKELSESKTHSQKLSRKLADEEQEATNLSFQIEHLKTVFGKLDDKRASLQGRIQELHSDLQREKAMRGNADAQCEGVADKFRVASNKNEHLTNTIREIRAQRDELQKKLAIQLRTSADLEAAVNRQEISYRELEEKLSVAKETICSNLKALDLRDSDFGMLSTELTNLKTGYRNLERMLTERTRDLDSATQDLANMTRENQAINSASQAMKIERDELLNQMNDAVARVGRVDGQLEELKRENTDLLAVYRKACDENSRLKRLVQELTSSRAKAIGENQIIQADISRFRQTLAEREEQCRRQQVDLTAFERQVAGLSRQMLALQSRLDRNEEERSHAERTAETARETSLTFVQREENLSWEIAQLRATVEKLEAKLSKHQAENESLHANFFREKRKNQELEILIAEARTAQAIAERSHYSMPNAGNSQENVILDQELSLSQDSVVEGERNRGASVVKGITTNQSGLTISGTSDNPDSTRLDRVNTLDEKLVNVSPIIRPSKKEHLDSVDTNFSSSGERSALTSSSEENTDNFTADLDHIINDQTNVINKLREDRARFDQAVMQASRSSQARFERNEDASTQKSMG